MIHNNALAWLTGELASETFPADISSPGQGGKFAHNGDVLAFPGNTFICHIPARTRFYQRLVALQAAISKLPSANNITFLPTESFHMTIFCGVSGEPLGSDGWPDGVKENTTLEGITALWRERLCSLKKPLSFSMRADAMRAPYSIRMKAANDETAQALVEARSSLETLTGLERGDLQSYEFHITLGYLLKWLSTEQAKQLIEQSNELFDLHLGDCGSIDLGPIEFCQFANMHRFELVKLID